MSTYYLSKTQHSMMSAESEPVMIENIDKYSFLDHFLYYGLLVGAFFQLACIFAVIFIPKSDSEKMENEIQDTGSGTPKHEQQLSRTGRNARREKKKHR